LHKRIRESVWLQSAGLQVQITSSVGVASYPGDSKTKADLLHLADEAMYNVKNSTRDAVAAATVGILPTA
ncbi:MAG TPA: diguanylate cyclase, partial [Candidatus Acidoferrales bacterium]|nr:diguanylate cyclase [Candidatus Acidoferrales bacterium]